MAEPSPFRGRVLYIARAPFISGAERALLSQLRHLDRAAVEPAVVLGHQTPLVELVRKLKVPVTVVPLSKRGRLSLVPWWRSLRRLRRVIAQFQPDLLHANDVPSCQAMSVLGAELRLPRVVHVRWVISAREMAWWARAGAEGVLCISRWMRAQLGDVAGTPLRAAQVEVLPDAVDWPALPPVPPPPRDGQELALGFAGQLIPDKGMDLLIEALALLPADSRPRLLVAGKDTRDGGAYEQQLRDLAAQRGVAGRITWLGFLDDVAQLYQQVDAVVCPSRVEPLGLVPLEAARYALPAVASRVGGLAETIQHGQTGYLTDPTPPAWAAALGQLNDRTALSRMGVAAQQRTRALYAPASYQQRLLAIYAQCATVVSGGARLHA